VVKIVEVPSCRQGHHVTLACQFSFQLQITHTPWLTATDDRVVRLLPLQMAAGASKITKLQTADTVMTRPLSQQQHEVALVACNDDANKFSS